MKKNENKKAVEEHQRSTPQERLLVFIFGTIFLALILLIAVFEPDLNARSFFIVRVALALAGAGIAALIPGFLNVQVSNYIRAGGAIAVFIVIYFFNPPPTDEPKHFIHEGFLGDLYSHLHENTSWDEFRLELDQSNREKLIDLYIQPEIKGESWAELLGKICSAYPCLKCTPAPGSISNKVSISLERGGKLKVREGTSSEAKRKPLVCNTGNRVSNIQDLIPKSDSVNIEGYINKVFLEKESAGKQILPEPAILRNGPSSNNKEIITIPKGQEIAVISIHGDWVRITTQKSNEQGRD